MLIKIVLAIHGPIFLDSVITLMNNCVKQGRNKINNNIHTQIYTIVYIQ